MGYYKFLVIISILVSILWRTSTEIYSHFVEDYELYIDSKLYIALEPYDVYLLMIIQFLIPVLGLFVIQKKMPVSNFSQRFKDGLVFTSIASIMYALLGIIVNIEDSINLHLASLAVYVPIGVIATLILEIPRRMASATNNT